MTDSASSHPARTPRRRPRLHHIYFLLAAFDLLTVTVSLLIIDHLVDRYSDTVVDNTMWAERMGQFSNLSSLAIRVNTPGNDVFNAEELTVDSAREDFKNALQEFREDEQTARADLLAMPGIFDVVSREQLMTMLNSVTNAMKAHEREATSLFDQFAAGQRIEAGQSMARMDQKYAVASNAINEIGNVILEAQGKSLESQAQAARLLRRFEILLGLLIVCMVSAVTVYGHRLSRQVRRSGEELEDLVATRTADLETTHDRLRMADRLASIGTLAAGLGHDINNILFPLRCHLESLRESELSPEAAKDVESIHRSTEYLQQLTNAIRMFARDPDAPSIVGSTRIDEWWSTVHTLMARSVGSEAHLHDRIQEGLPPVAIPPHQLTQAVLNLLVNAAEAIDARGTVTVWAERDGDDNMVRLGVTDNGIGMTEEVRLQALDPFFTTKARGKSTGLGLSMVHGVVTAAGGVVEIESQPGIETTIVLRLPISPDTEGHAQSERATPAATRRATIGVSDPRLCAFVTALVQAHGFETQRLNGGGDPGLDETTSLWVLDSDSDRIEAIRGRMGDSEMIVLTDDTSSAGTTNGDSLIQVDTSDLGQLRSHLSTLLHDISGRLA